MMLKNLYNTFSGSPPLSGCSLMALFLKCFLISSGVAVYGTPINSYRLLLSTSS